jgi:hypothetical protein
VKKSKVTALLERERAKARKEGEAAGRSEERYRRESIIRPQADSITWLGRPPESDRLFVPMPGGFMGRIRSYAEDMDPMFYRPTVISFRLRQKGITLSNGVVIRWADWEPEGPYPVGDISVPPGGRW